MEIGLGVLEKSVRDFWETTPHELFAALDGWNEKNGGGPRGKSSLGRRDVQRLKKMLAEAA